MRWTILIALVLLLLRPVRAQQIQNFGSPSSLDVATWNVEWFGSSSNGPSNDEQQYDNVLAVISQTGLDLWALQEVASAATFDRLLSDLGPGWDGELATVSGEQRIGFVYRTDTVRKRSSRHILEDYGYEFAFRLPLRLEVEVTLPDTTFIAVVVTVHMKAFADAESYDRRLEASRRLKSHFDFLERTSNLVWLGDLNDELRQSIRSGQPSPYANFVADPDDYRFLTMPLDLANECTFCGGSTSSTIDHILVSDEFFSAADAGQTDRMDYLWTALPGFLTTTSDHVPVYTRLLPAAANPTERFPTRQGPALYPLPARDQVTIELGRIATHPVTVRFVDTLGRRRLETSIPSGSRLVTVDTAHLPPGLYIVTIAGTTRLVPIVR